MSDWMLTKTRLFEGVWEGVLTCEGNEGAQPDVKVTLLGKPVHGVQLTEDAPQNRWVLRIPIPQEAVADGVQTFLITDSRTGVLLEKITMISGEVLSDDIRAEMDLLRAELDMLKRAFRRHCLETA
ncbi:hypothetical protein SAMN05444000_10920 [Shimia gijangensis]|uniref:Uncharacterized protein n=1 Tax=Shimia gijangensis TaxID=1470563 RepID=A0A1M6JH12_9RHOB|nr:hypothetical protein [Shimia gijangensis]SHJ45993.1 hypothetical protein SAMN05444000_10920 [Shimia gijangensis]